jgi:hypothetical protein
MSEKRRDEREHSTAQEAHGVPVPAGFLISSASYHTACRMESGVVRCVCGVEPRPPGTRVGGRLFPGTRARTRPPPSPSLLT